MILGINTKEKKGSFNHQRCIVHQVRKRLFRYGHFGGYGIIKSAPFLLGFLFCGDLIMPKVRCYFHVNAPIYSIILLENQVFTPDLLVGKLSNI